VQARADQEVFRTDSLLGYLQERRAGLDEMDEDVREIQQEAKRENDRHGVLEAVKIRTGIVGKQLQLADLLGAGHWRIRWSRASSAKHIGTGFTPSKD
jgi:hypothetical protein